MRWTIRVNAAATDTPAIVEDETAARVHPLVRPFFLKVAASLFRLSRGCRFTAINAPDTDELLPAPDGAVLVHHQVAAANRSHRLCCRVDVRPNCRPGDGPGPAFGGSTEPNDTSHRGESDDARPEEDRKQSLATDRQTTE